MQIPIIISTIPEWHKENGILRTSFDLKKNNRPLIVIPQIKKVVNAS